MPLGQPRPDHDRSDRAVAVIGASRDRAKYGNKAVRAYVEAGYTVWPVNPHADTIEGLPVFHAVEDLPGVPHRATLYLREEPALETLDALARLEEERGGRITAVYLNPDVDTPAVVERADSLGFTHVEACSIRAIGRTPDEFPDD
jgi:predicted CoA-binding protein